MSKINLTSKEWCDLVFEGKNKDYGAYEMRRDSTRRHNKALIIIVILALLVFYLPILIRIVVPKRDNMKMTEVTTLSKLKSAEAKTEQIKPLDTPPPPPLKSSIKFTPPVIKKDNEVADEDEIKSQEEVMNSKVAVSVADIKGTDEKNGKDIAEFKEVTQAGPAEEKPYTTVEQMPAFPGGDAALLQYLSKNLKYPAVAQENGIQGKVIVRFVVSKTGDVGNVEVLKGIDPSCDKEAIRVVKMLPKFIPGKQNGNNVPVYYMLPVTFSLRN